MHENLGILEGEVLASSGIREREGRCFWVVDLSAEVLRGF